MLLNSNTGLLAKSLLVLLLTCLLLTWLTGAWVQWIVLPLTLFILLTAARAIARGSFTARGGVRRKR